MNSSREKIIIRTSILGIAVNLLLVGFKAFVGFLAGSISIILDAVNNATDMLSSVVTIIGAKMANRMPDKEHPYGHGRIEYLTTLVVGLIILAAGVMAFIEALPKIISPEKADYSLPTVIIVVVAVLVKFFFGRFVKNVGRKNNSSTLVASGTDAIMDAFLSFGTLIGIFITILFDVSIDGWIGAAISIFIVRTSIEMLGDGLIDTIGRRIDSSFSKKLKTEICKFKNVSGAYDLTLHNYGPNTIIGSVHIQIPDKLTAREIHKLTREITTKIFKEFGVILTIGIYAENQETPESRKIFEKLKKITDEIDEILQLHGFYFDESLGIVAFDLVTDYNCENPSAIKKRVVKTLKQDFPNYHYQVNLDSDISD